MIWNIKTSSFATEETEDKSGKKSRFYKAPDFKDFSIGLSGGKLQFKLDSIRVQQEKQILECNKLLGMLPRELVEEAYESCNLEHMGVEYQYAKTPQTDSLANIQLALLYDQASQLAENTALFGEYRFEKYKRVINGVCLSLLFLIFATLGYCSRNTTMSRIFGIAAIIIVSIYMLNLTTRFIEIYLKEIFMHAR